MTVPTVAPPSVELLGQQPGPPDAATIASEVRTNASIRFDPKAAPAFLTIARASFGALAVASVELAWPAAQDLQLWLLGPPAAGGVGATREEALKDFIETLEIQVSGAPQFFADYVGLFLDSDVAHGSYTLVIGLHVPVSNDDYQAIWLAKLNALKANPATRPWYDDLMVFMKLIFAQATSREQFLSLASNVGDLKAPGHGIIGLFL